MCLQLLEAMSLPSSAQVLISTLDVPSDSSFFTLASHIGGHASRENAPLIRSIAMDLFEGRGPMMGPANLRQPARLGIAGRTSRSRRVDRTTERGSYISIEALTPMAYEGQYLKHVMQSWPLSSATHLDMRSPHITVNHLEALFAGLPATATTVIVQPGSKTAHSLLTKLRTQLREHGRRVFTTMIFDAAGVNTNEQAMRIGRMQWGAVPLPFSLLSARYNMIQMMLYCAEAARAGVPLDTVEIFNEPRELWKSHRLIDHVEAVNWSELYGDLQNGFVYEGILHSGKPDRDGREWESFAIVES
ncbi:hypothetical protein PENSPDRAFT_670331 [Peniophora sp. CONT]|nr:hypothetical protein PENSPDRAFT_670331 [Peniophora sp. CONT]